jgi:hypothetical protein
MLKLSVQIRKGSAFNVKLISAASVDGLLTDVIGVGKMVVLTRGGYPPNAAIVASGL